MNWLYSIHLASPEVTHESHWIVFIRNRLTRRVVTLACFHYRAECERWAIDAIKRKAWRNASELPDLFG